MDKHGSERGRVCRRWKGPTVGNPAGRSATSAQGQPPEYDIWGLLVTCVRAVSVEGWGQTRCQ